MFSFLGVNRVLRMQPTGDGASSSTAAYPQEQERRSSSGSEGKTAYSSGGSTLESAAKRIVSGRNQYSWEIISNLNPLSRIIKASENKEEWKRKLKDIQSNITDINCIEAETFVKENLCTFNAGKDAYNNGDDIKKYGLIMFSNDIIKQTEAYEMFKDRGKKPVYSLMYYDEATGEIYSEFTLEDLQKLKELLNERHQTSKQDLRSSSVTEQQTIESKEDQSQFTAKQREMCIFFVNTLNLSTIEPTNEASFWQKKEEKSDLVYELLSAKATITLIGENHGDEFPAHVTQHLLSLKKERQSAIVCLEAIKAVYQPELDQDFNSKDSDKETANYLKLGTDGASNEKKGLIEYCLENKIRPIAINVNTEFDYRTEQEKNPDCIEVEIGEQEEREEKGSSEGKESSEITELDATEEITTFDLAPTRLGIGDGAFAHFIDKAIKQTNVKDVVCLMGAKHCDGVADELRKMGYGIKVINMRPKEMAKDIWEISKDDKGNFLLELDENYRITNEEISIISSQENKATEEQSKSTIKVQDMGTQSYFR